MLKKTRKCSCQIEWYIERLHPEYKEFPFLCPWCHGKGEYETPITLYCYKGNFEPSHYRDRVDEQDNLYFYFVCRYCKTDIQLSWAGDTVACICGYIYRLNVSVVVDKSHVGDIEWIIARSNKEDEE